LLLSLFAGTTRAADTSSYDRRKLDAAVDAWLRPYVSAGDFSGVVLIAAGDRVLVERAYGMADRQRGIPNTAATRFRVASLSKAFTAAAIRLLVSAGKLSLSDPLGRFVPGVPNGDTITIQQLLTHESGVGEIDAADNFTECLSNEETLRRIGKTPPLFAPGAGDSYSNEGYFLLALVIEKVSGESYAGFLKKHIFDPLGMKRSGTSCLALPRAREHALGYVPSAKGGVSPLPFPEAAHDGPASVYSTAGDLYLWLRAVDNVPAFQLRGSTFGWGRRNYSGRDLVEQSGILEGYLSHMALYPKEHVYAVVLSNVHSGLLNRVPKDLEAVVFGAGTTSRPPEVRPSSVAEETLRGFAGSYKTESIPAPLNLVVKDGVLYQRWGNYPFARALMPTGSDAFFLRYEYASVRFERDASGRVVRTVWQWPGGEPVVFDRVGP
jgi:CubicO group peptidase (beta-lactamase class C family)